MKRFKNFALLVAMLLCGITQAFAETITLNDWTSTNHENNSISSETYTFTIDEACCLQFEWSVSSEGNCDRLIVTLDGTQILEKSGEISGSFIRYISSGTYTMVVSYRKDGSVHRGTDQAIVSNITLSGTTMVSQNGISYAVSEDSTACVVGVSNSNTDVIIPSVINIDGVVYSVNSIVSGAFANCQSVENIIIPESICSIEQGAFNACTGELTVLCNVPSYAFYDAAFTKVTIGESVSLIGDYAFYHCTGLSTITLPEGITSIGDYAFYHCTGLSSITLPEGVTSIGDCAFSHCTGLSTITLPEGITSIGNNAFYSCSNLASVTIPASLKNMGFNIFLETSWYNDLSNGVIYIGDVLYGYKGSMPENTTVEVREGTVSILPNAFNGASNLVSISMPESLTSIGARAFNNCDNLAAVTIPESVILIGDYAFNDCDSLSSLIISEGLASIGERAFYSCDNLVAVTIPNSTNSIGSYAFANCSKLSSVVYSENSVSIGYNAFYSTPWLNSWVENQSNGVIYLGDVLYKYKGGMSDNTTIVVREGTTRIEASAFSGCSGLVSIVIPESVISIGNYAFQNCSNLTSITIPDGVTTIAYCAFKNCSSLASITIPNGVTSIEHYAFQNCGNLESVILPGSLTSIGSGAFENCSSLASIIIPEGVTSIGDYAFDNCSSLTSITIPKSVTSLGHSAFDGILGELIINCEIPSRTIEEGGIFRYQSFSNVVIGDNVTSIGDNAFYGCSNLSRITIPASVLSIGNGVFNECTNLKEVIFEDGDSVLSLGYNSVGYYNEAYGYYESDGKGLFYDCPLINLYLGRNLDYNGNYEYGYSPFYNKNSLKSVAIGEYVTRIGDNTFDNCYNLSEVHISSIEAWCDIEFSSNSYSHLLRNAKNLYLNGELVTELVIPNTVTVIKPWTFCGFSGSIMVPNSVESIGDGAFYDVSEILMEAVVPPALTTSRIISDKGVIVVSDEAFSAYQTAPYWKELVGNMTSVEKSKREVTLEAKSNMSALHQALGDAALPCVVDLTINGTINSYDFMVMLNKMNNLRHLNLSNAHIVYNGYEHYTGCHSENNKLPAYAFYQKNLLSVELPQDITSVGQYAFSKCNGLTSVFIPKSVTNVDAYAFANCTSLANVSFEGGASINERAFSECSRLSSVDILGGVSSIGSYAFSGCSGLSSINITGGVSSIGSYAFSGCSGLLEMIIPNISGSIDSYAFENCSSLKFFTVLNGFTSIGSRAFSGCSSLKTVSFDEVSNIGFSAFGQSNSYPYSGACVNLSSITILKGLKTIGERAFSGCYGLKNVDLPAGLTTIGNYAFNNCDGLKQINIPDGVTSIGSNAFSGCSYLESIKLPTTLQTINSSAFSGCSRLGEVHIPSSVRNIHESAFSGCTNMKKVYVYTIEPTAISQNTFAMNSNNNFVGTLYAPKVSYYVYWYDTQWSQFEDIQPFDEPYDNFYLKGDLELNDSTGVVQGTEGEKPDAELGSNSGLVTDGNIDQELGDVEIEHDGTNGGSIVAGGNSSVEVDNLTFRITVTGGRWYFFCFPFDVRREDIKCENGADWVFRYYDGGERAQNGRGGWKNVTSDGNGNHLKAATGYIFQCSKNDVLILTAKNQKIKQEKKYNELVEHVTQNMQDASWNFVGNPYLSYYDITGEEYSAPITIWNGSSYVAIRPGDDDHVLSPFEAFFVQKPEGVNDIEYDPEQQMTYYQMRMAAEQKAAARRTRTIDPDRLLVNITLSDTATTDRTRVVFNNDADMEYEINCDAAKFTTAGVPQIYTIGNRAVKYAINERPVAEGIVTVGYTAPVQGNYTLAAPRMDVPVYLKDNRTGILHDFSEGDYTFMTEAGTFEDRFTIVMKSDATSIDKSQLINDEEAPLYNTKGQWVDEPQGQGVYIKDNRKVVKL